MSISERQALSVTEVNIYIKNKLNNDDILADILVKGELSNFKAHSSGHMYMSLKDDTGVIRAVMFRTNAIKLGFTPKNGMKVIARGRISVYERDGQYQLYINDMQQEGIGDLYVAFEKLKAKLDAEGLFSGEHKKPLPKYPKKVGVITAPTGAAIRDIINVLSRRFLYSDIVLYPVLVQGENSAQSIIKAIDFFDTTRVADVIILGRGGGSIEDLWSFNEEGVARAIYKCQIPIVSAVGHEIDYTISDFVSDLRAPTPSAAAELVVPSQTELHEKFNNVYTRLFSQAKRIIEQNKLRVKYCTERPVFTNPVQKIDEQRLYLDRIAQDLLNITQNIFLKKRKAADIAVSKLDSLSPLATLGRGYSLTKNKYGSVVRSCTQVSTGDEIEIVVSDGKILATVDKIDKSTKE